MKPILILAAALLLTACSSFKLGAFCYLPHGMAGECRITPSSTAEPTARAASAP